jgi:hypothetical protein
VPVAGRAAVREPAARGVPVVSAARVVSAVAAVLAALGASAVAAV